MTAVRVIDSHLELADIGLNTHDQIDTELSSLRHISSSADSPMIVTGGEVTEGTNAGTFKVAELTALLRSTDSAIGNLVSVSLAEHDNQSIPVADTIYIISLNYNGGSPTISLSVSNPYSLDKRNIPIGRVMKDAAGTVHYISGGYRFQDGVEKLHDRARTTRKIELESGSTIAYSGTNNFTMTEGVAYGGINKFLLTSYNSATTTFTPVYQDGGGGWTEGAASNAIDHTHYDDGSGVLATIGNNKYGCFWVYKHIGDGHVYVLYGRDSYTRAKAEAEGEPTRPDHLIHFGLLVGKIIAPKAGGSFTEVQMVTDIFFTGVAVADHNNLGGLQGGTLGEYYHLTSAELTKLGGIAEGAEVNVQSDWDAVDGDALILNKPSDITDLSGHNVTELSDVTGAGSGIIISAAERTKLNGIEEGATADQTKADIDSLGLSHDNLVDVSADDHHAELHSIASHNDTSATGAQLNTLTNNSIADTLHRHSELVASDGSPDPVLSINASGQGEIIGSTYPVFRNTRTTSGLSSAGACFDNLLKTSGDMADGFGPGITLSIQDDTAGPYYIAGIYARRKGADDQGDLLFYTNGVSWGTKMILTYDGKLAVGTTSPVTSAKLQLDSTTGALLLTRMTTTQRDALTAVNGMILYNSTLNKFQGYENGSWTNLI